MSKKIDITPIIELKNYFESPDFMRKFSIIQGQKKISGMSLEAKGSVVKGLEYEEFQKVCYSIYQCLSERVITEEDDQGYASDELTYRGYNFSRMDGYGVTYFHCDRIKR